ncbi:MAG: HAD family phosphatase [Pyrinomonadaceae bacterium]|nr:HAD family phosphatase [Pyrinomonadaceae bacterium]
MIKGILFDFNGVIIDDEPVHLKAYQQVLKRSDIELSEADYYESLGMDDVRFVEAAFKRVGKDLSEATLQNVLDEKLTAYRSLISDHLPLFDGAVNLAKQLQHHYILGIVSMARREDIEAILHRADIYNCFSAIVSAEEVTNCKPNPEGYNLGFRKLDEINTRKGGYALDRANVVAIEDAPPGIIAAKTAGLKVLGVANTVSVQALRDSGADSVTKTLADMTHETFDLVFGEA